MNDNDIREIKPGEAVKSQPKAVVQAMAENPAVADAVGFMESTSLMPMFAEMAEQLGFEHAMKILIDQSEQADARINKLSQEGREYDLKQSAIQLAQIKSKEFETYLKGRLGMM